MTFLRPMTAMAPIVCLAVGYFAAGDASEEHTAVVRAREKFEKEVESVVAPVRGRYLADLKSLKTNLKRNNDVQGVAAVDAEIERVTEIERLWERHFLQGLWQVDYSNTAVRTYRITNTGAVRFIEAGLTGRIRRLGDDYVLDFGDGKIERLTFQPTIKVDHFNPRSLYPLGAPTAVGTGVPTRR